MHLRELVVYALTALLVIMAVGLAIGLFLYLKSKTKGPDH